MKLTCCKKMEERRKLQRYLKELGRDIYGDVAKEKERCQRVHEV